jgi:stage V sporulation protein G
MTEHLMNIHVEHLHRLDGDGTLKAFADIKIDHALVIKGFRVIDGKNGMFVGMPRHSSKQDQWYDSVVPLSASVRQQLNTIVLDAYHSEAAHIVPPSHVKKTPTDGG